MRRPAVVVLAVAALAAVLFFGNRWWRAREHANTAIRGSGIIEVTQVDVAFEVAGRMVERFVDEGAMVDKGEPVAPARRPRVPPARRARAAPTRPPPTRATA